MMAAVIASARTLIARLIYSSATAQEQAERWLCLYETSNYITPPCGNLILKKAGIGYRRGRRPSPDTHFLCDRMKVWGEKGAPWTKSVIGHHLDNDGRAPKQGVTFHSEVWPGDFPLEGDRGHCPPVALPDGLYHELVPASTVVIFKLTVRLTGNGLAFMHRNRLHLNLRSWSVSHGIWFSLQALTETFPQNRSFPARKNSRDACSLGHLFEATESSSFLLYHGPLTLMARPSQSGHRPCLPSQGRPTAGENSLIFPFSIPLS